MGAIFQPNVWDWLFGAGIGTNLGATIVVALCSAPAIVRAVRRFRHHMHLTEELHHLAHTGIVHPRARARLTEKESQ